MNENKNSNTVGEAGSESQSPQVIHESYEHHQPNKILSFFNTPKKRFATFAVMFGVVGVVAIALSFAATSHERNLVDGFRNFAKNRPTVVSGNASMAYKASPNLTDMAAYFSTKMDHKTGNSFGKGRIAVNNVVFPYEYATVEKLHYFKLGNTPALRNVVKPSSQAYSYLAPRFTTLDQINNQWLVQMNQHGMPSGLPSSAPYACLLNSGDIRLTAADARQLQASILRNSPLKVKKVSNTTVNGEAVTESALVMNDIKKVNAFAATLSRLEAVRKIDDCAQKVASTKSVPKVRDALRDNNVKISVYMNKQKIIKKITVNTSGKKATLRLTADFRYEPQTPIVQPKGAIRADDFIRKMTGAASLQLSDKAKESDLYKLNLEIEKYIIKNRMLPFDLDELKVLGLQGMTGDYEYSYTSRTTDGGPTLSYRTCAVFAAKGTGKIEYGTSNITPQVFTKHLPGKACYENGFYKGSSHIGLMR